MVRRREWCDKTVHGCVDQDDELWATGLECELWAAGLECKDGGLEKTMIHLRKIIPGYAVPEMQQSLSLVRFYGQQHEGCRRLSSSLCRVKK